MYKVIFIENDEMTRNIILENSYTGTINKCFDDSALVSDKCFDFVKVGNIYHCKIKLFGNIVENMKNNDILCEIICRDIVIGTKKMIKVLVENDYYYIPKKKFDISVSVNSFYFRYSRKDLIQVNDVIHADFL